MRLPRWLNLPWRARQVVRSLRTELSECRQQLDEFAREAAAREVSQRELAESLRNEIHTALGSLQDRLIGEIREQGLLHDTAIRYATRAAAEARLRARLPAPVERSPGLSILIACWNHAAHLERSVASALATVAVLECDGEVLILDDASRDGSQEIAAALADADERIRLIASEENIGLPRARNVLLSQAHFEHALMLDSDNELVSSGVAALFESARQTGAVLTYGNILKVDAEGNCLDIISNERLTPKIRERNWIDAMALVRTERILTLGGYDGQWLHGLEDWELNQRLFALRESVVFVPVLVGRYSTLPGSMLRQAPTSQRVRLDARMFGTPQCSDNAQYRAGVHHPALGTLWASPGWSADAPVAAQVRTVEKPLRVLVVSSGGVLNYGDDAILLSTLQRLRRLRPQAVASVITDGPHVPRLGRLGAWLGTCDEFLSGVSHDDLRRGCQDDRALVSELTQYFPLSTARGVNLRAFDLVLLAGGGNLCRHFPEIVARRAAIAAAANSHGVPYLITGQGVGPIAEAQHSMLSFLVRGATAVGTRDVCSRQLLRQMAAEHARIDVVGDDALGLRCVSRDESRRFLVQAGVPADRPLLAFQAREASYVGLSRRELQATADQVDRFAAAAGFEIVALPINMQAQGTEADLLAQLAASSPRRAAWHLPRPEGDVALIAGLVKACQAVLTHSFHMAVFALEERIPTLLFSGSEYYELKAAALRSAFGVPVPIGAAVGMPAEQIAQALALLASSPWSTAHTSADVDLWLAGALPDRTTGAISSMMRWPGQAAASWAGDLRAFTPGDVTPSGL